MAPRRPSGSKRTVSVTRRKRASAESAPAAAFKLEASKALVATKTRAKQEPESDSEPLRVTADEILRAQNDGELSELLERLQGDDLAFSKYKTSMSSLLEQQEQMIVQLNEKIGKQQEKEKALVKEMNRLKYGNVSAAGTPVKRRRRDRLDNGEDNDNGEAEDEDDDDMEQDDDDDDGNSLNPKMFMSPIRQKTQTKISEPDMVREMENIAITFDMLELLTGVKVNNFQDDDTKFYFEVKQASRDNEEVFIEYSLVLLKDLAHAGQIQYDPTFLQSNDEERVELLKQILPAKLCGPLTFHYDTIAQFYDKVSRALTKASHNGKI